MTTLVFMATVQRHGLSTFEERTSISMEEPENGTIQRSKMMSDGPNGHGTI